MGAPPTVLFNRGSLPTGWVERPRGTGTIEWSDGGIPILRVFGGNNGGYSYGEPWSSFNGLSYEIPAGDFDLAVVLEFPSTNTGVLALSGALTVILASTAGAGTAGAAGSLARYGSNDFMYAPTTNSVAYIGAVAYGELTRDAPGGRSARHVLRVQRIGTTLKTWRTLNPLAAPGAVAWCDVGSGNQSDLTSPDFAGAMSLGLGSRASVIACFRAVVNLDTGTPAAPSAPTGGLAASAPMTGDADLGVGFVWDAPAADTTQTVEILTATNAGFTAGVQTIRRDYLLSGEPPSTRRGGCTVGQTIYGKARFIDELGQPGAWSAAVSAVVAVTPSIMPVFTHPVAFTLPLIPKFTVV